MIPEDFLSEQRVKLICFVPPAGFFPCITCACLSLSSDKCEGQTVHHTSRDLHFVPAVTAPQPPLL